MLLRLPIVASLLLFLGTTGCAQNNPSSASHQPVAEHTDTFPFEIDGHTVRVEIESTRIFESYNPLFVRHRYSGNGYSWEGHIVQILEQLDPALLEHVVFDPEAGAFFAYIESPVARHRFVQLLSPIFSDLQKLESFIQRADRSRIDD